jgi:8-oxo-dGTP diphosphatase
VTRSREYPERPLLGVGGVVISERSVLLVRRGSPPLEGEWSIPGGILETGETIFEAVRRELLEETGVEVRVLELIEVFERISLDGDGRAKYHFVVLDYFCEAIRGQARAGSDAAEIAWTLRENLGEYKLSLSALRVIEKAFEMARERPGRTDLHA